MPLKEQKYLSLINQQLIPVLKELKQTKFLEKYIFEKKGNRLFIKFYPGEKYFEEIKLDDAHRKKALAEIKEIKEIETIEIPDFIPANLKKEYLKISEKLIRRNILKEEDKPAYNLIWYHYSVCLEAIEKIKEYGIVFKDRKIVRKNPAIQIFRDHSRLFNDYASQFGLMPIDRRGMLLSSFNISQIPDLIITDLNIEEEDINKPK